MGGVRNQRSLNGWTGHLLRTRVDRLQIAYHVEPDYEIGNCLAMHDELERRGLITNNQ